MPNRLSEGWKERMEASINEYKQCPEFDVLTKVPVRPDKIIERLEYAVETAYKSGYRNGRKSKK
jgi:hypothetical protein